MANSASCAKIISVMSGKGGTGKSTITAALAKALALKKCRVLAVDLDIGLRSLDILLSLENKVVFDFGDILDSKCKLDAAVVPHTTIKGLYLLSSPNKLSKSFTIEGLISLIKTISASFDYILLDMPAGLGISIIMASRLADLNLLITTPDTTTLRDTKKVVDALSDTSDITSRLIINRVSRHAIQLSTAENLDEIIDKIGVQLLGVIPEDEWINAGNNLKAKKKSKNSKLSKEIIDAIARRIQGEYVPLILREV